MRNEVNAVILRARSHSSDVANKRQLASCQTSAASLPERQEKMNFLPTRILDRRGTQDAPPLRRLQICYVSTDGLHKHMLSWYLRSNATSTPAPNGATHSLKQSKNKKRTKIHKQNKHGGNNGNPPMNSYSFPAVLTTALLTAKPNTGETSHLNLSHNTSKPLA